MKVCGESLGQGFRLKECFSGGLASLDRTECLLQMLSELLTGFASDPFNPLFHTTIGSNDETDRSLGHPDRELGHAC